MIGATIEDMAAWSKLGAFIELNATVFVPESRFCTNDIGECRQIIDAVGLEKIVLDSDYGQNKNGSPVAGLKKFIEMLKETCGLDEAAVKQVSEDNPSWLLSLE